MAAPFSSEHGIFPQVVAELQHRSIPSSATAKKVELFKLLFPPSTATTSVEQPSLQTITTSLMQIHKMLNSMFMSLQDLQRHTEALEQRPVTNQLLLPPQASFIPSFPAGIINTPPFVTPAHVVPINIRKDILVGKYINLASLLIAAHDVVNNRSYAYGGTSVILKSKSLQLCRHFSGLKFPVYSICKSSAHTANWCPNTESDAITSTSRAMASMPPAPSQMVQLDKLVRLVWYIGKA